MPAVKGNITYVKARNRRVREELAQEGRRAGQYRRRALECADRLRSLEGSNAAGSEIQAIKAQADIYLRLLNKYQPDLRAVEQSLDIRQRHITELTTEELMAIAAGGRDSGQKVPALSNSEGGEPA